MLGSLLVLYHDLGLPIPIHPLCFNRTDFLFLNYVKFNSNLEPLTYGFLWAVMHPQVFSRVAPSYWRRYPPSLNCHAFHLVITIYHIPVLFLLTTFAFTFSIYLFNNLPSHSYYIYEYGRLLTQLSQLEYKLREVRICFFFFSLEQYMTQWLMFNK